eukprot:4881168-Pyramimonas_sp.AAC.1
MTKTLGAHKRARAAHSKPTIRQPTPGYNAMELNQAMEHYVENKGIQACFNFGVHNGPLAGQAVRGHGLAQIADFVVVLLGVAPYGYILLSHLKQSVSHVASCFEGLHPDDVPRAKW